MALRIGHVPGVTLTKWRRIWAERHPRDRLGVEAVSVAQQRAVLDDGLVDMCFVRLPVDATGLHIIPLYEEQPVVWLSKDHELAALDEITAQDLAEVRVIEDAAAASIELATYSAAVLRVPMSIARSGSRKDLVYRPAVDAQTTTVGLAWRTDDTHPLIDEFIGVVRGRSANSSRTVQERRKSAPKSPPTRARATRRRGRR